MQSKHTPFDIDDCLEEIKDQYCGFENNSIPVITKGTGESSLHVLPFSCDPGGLLDPAFDVPPDGGATERVEGAGAPRFPADAPILVAGSSEDAQIAHFLERVKKTCVVPLLTGPGADACPPFTWVLKSDELLVHRTEVRPKAAFVRFDFHAESGPSPNATDPEPATVRRTHAWHAAVSAWLAAHPEVRTFNRNQRVMRWHKPAVLAIAARAGLAVPDTVFGNDIDALRRPHHIVKPIDGRGFCQRLDAVLSGVGPNRVCAQPVTVQPELAYPELRVYVVGDERFAISIQSEDLDYRATDLDEDDVKEAVVPPQLLDGLNKLVSELGLDFCAVDFKTQPGSPGEYVLLDVNDAPLFADCDSKLNCAITRAMVKFLLAP